MIQRKKPFCFVLLLGVMYSVGTYATNGSFRWGDVCDQVKQSIVHVHCYNVVKNEFEPHRPGHQGHSTGTGFFIDHQDGQGYLLTNFHVIKNARLIKIEMPDHGKDRFEAEIVRVRPKRDVALLRIKNRSLSKVQDLFGGTIPTLKLADSDAVVKTQEVMAIGFPLTDEGLKMTTGIISGKERVDNQHFIQITAPLNFGNSGGPTVDKTGAVVGINTAGLLLAQNTGWMVPINDVSRGMLRSSRYSQDQEAHSVVERLPIWGLLVQRTNEELHAYKKSDVSNGLYICKVLEDSLCSKNGLLVGDIITSINGYAIDRHGYASVPWCQDKVYFSDILQRTELGDTVTFHIVRDGESTMISFPVNYEKIFAIDEVFTNFEPMDYEIFGGMVFARVTHNHLRQAAHVFFSGMGTSNALSGFPHFLRYLFWENAYEPRIFVSHVFDGSYADEQGVVTGNVIKAINGKPVTTLEQLRSSVLANQDDFLVLEMEKGTLHVFDVAKLVEQENDLRQAHEYPETALVNALVVQ